MFLFTTSLVLTTTSFSLSGGRGGFLSWTTWFVWVITTPVPRKVPVALLANGRSDGNGIVPSTVDVTLNGVTVISGATIQSGSSTSISFSASTGSLIALSNWVTGSYTNEVSWEIRDVNGTIISSGVFGELGTAVGNCCPIIKWVSQPFGSLTPVGLSNP